MIFAGKEHSDYIFKYAAWVLEVSPEEGLKIFTEEVREGDYLPRPKVLDFLLKANKPNLVILYLVSNYFMNLLNLVQIL